MLPNIANDLNATTGQVGLLVSVYALGMAIGGPIIAYVLRRSSPRSVLTGIIAAYAIIEIIAPVVHAYWGCAPISSKSPKFSHSPLIPRATDDVHFNIIDRLCR
ncbi:TPA: MFS transporter [Proteus mirabilis]|nr:MFS transporter [Proteus mirabilis]